MAKKNTTSKKSTPEEHQAFKQIENEADARNAEQAAKAGAQ